MHLLNREQVNFVSDTEKSGPVALNDGQQAGHLSNNHGLVGHRIGYELLRRPMAPAFGAASQSAVNA